MALKRANVAVESVSSKSEVPVFAIAGNDVTQFNKVSAKIKDLEGEQKELRATIERDGLTKLFNYNLANSHNAVSSVKLEDESDGGQVRISFQDSYKAADPDKAVACLEEAARRGHPEAEFELGLFCEEAGLGPGGRDQDEALAAWADEQGVDVLGLAVGHILQRHSQIEQVARQSGRQGPLLLL